MCLDGSPSGYYLQLATDNPNWVVYLEAGGWCMTQAECVQMSKTEFGSSTMWDTIGHEDFGGVLSANDFENPVCTGRPYLHKHLMHAAPHTMSKIVCGPIRYQKACRENRLVLGMPAFFVSFTLQLLNPSNHAFLATHIGPQPAHAISTTKLRMIYSQAQNWHILTHALTSKHEESHRHSIVTLCMYA